MIKFANTRSRGRVCLFYQNDLIFMQKVQSPEKARRLFMKLSVYDIVYVSHAWVEFVAGLLFSPVSFCNSADPPWIPGFCRLCASTHLLALAAGFVFENKGIVSVVFLIFCRRLINITRQLSYFCQLIVWRWHFKTLSNSLARVFRSQMNTWQMFLSGSSYNSMVNVRSIFIERLQHTVLDASGYSRARSFTKVRKSDCWWRI